MKYLASFFFPACVLFFLAIGPHTIINALAWTIPLWFIILIDWLSPKVVSDQQRNKVSDWFYDLMLYVLTLMQFLIIGLLLIAASQLQWNSVDEILISVVNLIVMRILVGTSSGSSAIIVAHELIHRPKKHQRILGRLLLYTVCYDHFVIAHMRGHHLKVATPDDMTTAHLGESFSSYWKRVFIGHFKYAWNSEQKRLGLIHLPICHYNVLFNSVLQGLVVEIILILLIINLFGWAACFIFLFQALSGVRLLETINYFQHWGLGQEESGNAMAWVNQSSFTEYALVGLANHINHHQNATTSFIETPYSDQGPKMPYGYFVTNLWVKLNNESYRKVSATILKTYFK